jgi:hypothetical protein
MFLNKNKNWDKPFSEKVANRIDKIPTADLPLWADQVLTELGRALSQYEKQKEKHILDELMMGAESFHAIVDALHRRSLL